MTAFIALRVPHLGDPEATIYYSRADYIERMYRASAACDRPMYSEMTASELRGCFAEDDRLPKWLRDAPDDQRFYRAGWIDDEYEREPIDEFEAAKAFDFHDLSYGDIIELSDARDTIALLRGPDAPRIGKCGPRAAAAVLEQALARTEANAC